MERTPSFEIIYKKRGFIAVKTKEVLAVVADYLLQKHNVVMVCCDMGYFFMYRIEKNPGSAFPLGKPDDPGTILYHLSMREEGWHGSNFCAKSAHSMIPPEDICMIAEKAPQDFYDPEICAGMGRS